MDAVQYPPACNCWLLPTPAGLTPLAVLAHARRVHLRTIDGRDLVGELDWAYWHRDSATSLVLDVSVGETSTLLSPAEVAQVEVVSWSPSIEYVADAAAAGIKAWRHLPVGDEHYWDLVVGHHDLLEVTVKRTRLPCQPGATEIADESDVKDS